MSRTLRASIEKLAPTGEGLVRTNEGVGLVTGALPGEDVDVEVTRVTRKIWRGRVVAIRSPSPSPARAAGAHALGCPACDWAHVDLAAGRDFKRELFLETMRRIGRLDPDAFGELPIVPSPYGYRLRSRLHAAVRDGRVLVGGFAPGTHDVEALGGCEALSTPLRAILPRVGEALAPTPGREANARVDLDELATVESLDGSRRVAKASLRLDGRAEVAARIAAALGGVFDGLAVTDASGRTLHRSGLERLWLPVGAGGREVPAEPGAFFQANRFLVAELARHVGDLAAEVPSGRALDAFGGSGLFASALLEAGHAVTSVEGSPEAAASARAARERWGSGKDWEIVRASVLDFAARDGRREDVVVVDPPRAGLGAPLARALASRATRRLVYVSCDPATLARDLAILTESASGLAIRSARLFDLFAGTHRVEAVICLDRVQGA